MLICNLRESGSADTVAQRLFKSRWGHESCILWGYTTQAAFGPCTHTLSIRAAWGGQERCQIGSRTVAVDDDNSLILNHGQIYATRIDAPCGVESLAICFSPELIEQLHARTENALFDADPDIAGIPSFFDNLHPHEHQVSPLLQLIRRELVRGLASDAWFETQLIELLGRMRQHHSRLLRRLSTLPFVRAGTRVSIYRRIARATDFMHTHFGEDIDLNSIAQAAAISKYHFTRLFTLLHGIGPWAYLQRKRVHFAVRLLQATSLTSQEVATAVGLHDAAALRRQLRYWDGRLPQHLGPGSPAHRIA